MNYGYERALEKIRNSARTGSTELFLEGLGLTTIPPEIGALKNLTKLSAWNNRLEALPPEVWELTELKELCLWRNSIAIFPPEIKNLKKLEELDVSNNRLSYLPPEVGELRNLTKLNLSNNQLIKLPLEMGNLARLNTLLLSNNPLEFPPAIVVNGGIDNILYYLAANLRERGREKLEEQKPVEKTTEIPQPKPKKASAKTADTPESCVTLHVPDFMEPESTSEILVKLKNSTEKKIENISLDPSDMMEFFNVDGEVNVSYIKSGMELDYVIRIKPKILSGTIPVVIKVSVGGKTVEKEYTIKVGGTEVY